MSRSYYYSRPNSYSSRNKKAFKYKWLFLLLIIAAFFIFFSGEIAPQIEQVEISISQQIETLKNVQPSE